MKKLRLTFGIALVCAIVSLVLLKLRANNEYDNKIGSYWLLAERTATIDQKAEYRDLYIQAIRKEILIAAKDRRMAQEMAELERQFSPPIEPSSMRMEDTDPKEKKQENDAENKKHSGWIRREFAPEYRTRPEDVVHTREIVQSALAACYAEEEPPQVYNAMFFKNPGNNVQKNLEVLLSSQERLRQVRKIDVSSLAYQTAVQQVNAQEQGEAQEITKTIKGAWFLEPVVHFTCSTTLDSAASVSRTRRSAARLACWPAARNPWPSA
jgi:hypothetical protein